MMRRTILLSLVMLAAAGAVMKSYWINGPSWPSGSIPIYIQLGASPMLFDGCADWSCSASGAISRWNLFLGKVQMQAVPNAAQAKGELNGRNDMFFATDVYGKAFGADTLAMTTWWYRRDTLIEGDIGFNSAKHWDSYRGNTRTGPTYDLRRIAMHELGHVLGLGHPDDHGQDVIALMNSRIGNLDSLAVDDITGAQSLYGAPGAGTGGGGGSGSTINFPPRNETYDFRAWLETKYRDSLGRALGLSYSDVEGSVVWVQEYLRYRLNTCTHDQAVELVRIQIAGGGVPGVCGAPASTTIIAFPPRNETYAFRLQLESFYKDDLGRAAVRTTVDAEGDVVWIQEYLRYRLNGCTHSQSIDRVSQQIDGQGVPAVCR
jgi:hypothetical protein